jgi:hypothetical protein
VLGTKGFVVVVVVVVVKKRKGVMDTFKIN